MLYDFKNHHHKKGPPSWWTWARNFAGRLEKKSSSSAGDDPSRHKWVDEAPLWLLDDIGVDAGNKPGGGRISQQTPKQRAMQQASHRARRHIG